MVRGGKEYSHDSIGAATISIPHSPKLWLALDMSMSHRFCHDGTYRHVPNFHRHVPLPHLTQVESDGGHDIFRPLV